MSDNTNFKEKYNCLHCNKFFRYYIKNLYNYNKLDYGWCSVHQTQKNIDDNCYSYVEAPHIYEHNPCCRSVEKLYDEICSLRQIIARDFEDELK